MASTTPADGGCSSFTVSECGSFKVVSGTGYVVFSFFYDADGGLVGVREASDVVTECGAASQSFGEIPNCTVTSSMQVCPQ